MQKVYFTQLSNGKQDMTFLVHTSWEHCPTGFCLTLVEG